MSIASRRTQHSVIVGECGDPFALLNEDLAREHQAEHMRRFDLRDEHETIGNYRRRVQTLKINLRNYAVQN